MERYSKPMIFFMIVIIAPIFEEIFFRAPLTLFKKAKSFKNAFYVFAIIFGFIHLTNYKISTNDFIICTIISFTSNNFRKDILVLLEFVLVYNGA